MTSSPLEGLRADLISQRDFVRTRVPVYALLLDLLVAALARGELVGVAEAWAGRTFGAWYERPLLLLAALRDDALRQGRAHPLAGALLGPAPEVAAATAAALTAALAPGRTHLWHTLRTRHVQTNEPSRAVAWLWPASLSARADPGRAVRVVDVGASAGLNLIADQLPPRWRRPDGGPLWTTGLPAVVGRIGYDLRPLDARSDEDTRWLRALVWPGERVRQEGLERAIEALRSFAPDDAPRVEPVRAGDVPLLLPRVGRGEPRALVYQTVMRDYLPAEERERYEAGMRRWLRGSEPGGALWVEIEVHAEARDGGPPMAISAHLHTGGGELCTLVLGSCSPHPEVVDVHDEAASELLRLLGPG